jgi:hypothetical protein
MSSKPVKKLSSDRGKGENTQAHTPTRQKRWVKAAWTENKQSQCDAIPKSWVSRSLSTVWWPPSDLNYKKAIDMCWGPPPGSLGWSKFKLMWCSSTVDSLAEAQGIQTSTEMADTDASSSCEDEEQLSSAMDEDQEKTRRGRGLRY